MNKALLLHPYDNVKGNLRWPVGSNFDKHQITESLEKLRELGYWASTFPEGDGVAFSHEDYSSTTAVSHLRSAFDWLEIDECTPSDLATQMATMSGQRKIHCKVLVPICKLWIDEPFKIGEFHFWPPVEEDYNRDTENPWLEYFAGDISNFDAQPPSLGQSNDNLESPVDLLHYPLIEFDTDIYESDLISSTSKIDAQIRLIKHASEQAERALDLLRISYCHFNKIEYLPNRAGQVDNGSSVVYLMPMRHTYDDLFLQQIISPLRSSNNWLGLEAQAITSPFLEWLARVLRYGTGNEMEEHVRSCIIALSQAFYTMYDEARFLSLVFALDGLCSPERDWKGWTHRTYVAAVASGGDIKHYEKHLTNFEYLYSDIRNKLVHSGTLFVNLQHANADRSATMMQNIMLRCIEVVHENEITSIAKLRSYAKGFLSTNDFKQVTSAVINLYDRKRGKVTQPKHLPKW